MASLSVRLCQAVLTASAADLYTNATSDTITLRQVIIANPTGAAVAARLSLVPSGETADDSQLIVPDTDVPANDSIVLDAFQALAPGDVLNGKSATASGLVITATGVKV